MSVRGAAPVLVALACALAAASPLPAQEAAATPAPSPAAFPTAVVETEAGSFVIRLRPDLAPRHVKHFVKTARSGGYAGTTFHRVVPRAIIQGGDPLSRDPKRASQHGTGGLGLLKSEFTKEPMRRGSVAAVLRPRDPHSGGSQFFVCLADQPSLTGKFTIFGEIAEGLEVLDKLAETPVVGERPQKRLVLKSVTVRDAAQAKEAAQ